MSEPSSWFTNFSSLLSSLTPTPQPPTTTAASPSPPTATATAGIVPRAPLPPPRSRATLRPPPLLAVPKPRQQVVATEEEQALRDHLGKLYVNNQTYVLMADSIEDLVSIGRGCFGEVKRGKHRQSGTLLAVKYMRDTMKSEEKRRLLMEVNLCRQFSSPYLVRYHGVNVWDGDVQLFMELMRMSLDRLMIMAQTANTHIPEDVMGRITVSLLRALDYMRENFKVMHRDIKPNNVLLGFDGRIKLCDFGIANIAENSLLHSHVGSELYLAPERVYPRTPNKTYDTRSDVWSLGLTLCELAHLRFPYTLPDVRTVFAVVAQVLNEPAPTPPPGRYAADFDELVHSCLMKNVDDRPKYRKPSACAPALLNHSFYDRHAAVEDGSGVDVIGWVATLENLQ